MEKIACVLWKPAGVPDDVYGKDLRAIAPELVRLGAMNLRINVVDEHVAAALLRGSHRPAERSRHRRGDRADLGTRRAPQDRHRRSGLSGITVTAQRTKAVHEIAHTAGSRGVT